MVLSHISHPLASLSADPFAPPTLNERTSSFNTTALKRRREEMSDREEIRDGGDLVLEAFQKQLGLFEEQTRGRKEMGI